MACGLASVTAVKRAIIAGDIAIEYRLYSRACSFSERDVGQCWPNISLGPWATIITGWLFFPAGESILVLRSCFLSVEMNMESFVPG